MEKDEMKPTWEEFNKSVKKEAEKEEEDYPIQ